MTETTTTEIDLLDGVLAKTTAVLAGVTPEQRALPTPCPEFDVQALLNHIVGWARVFDAGTNDREMPGDPESYEVGDDAAAEFEPVARSIVAGWAEHGIDREVRTSGGASPGEMVFNMTVMEYLTHGWDLATATGQPIPYTEAEGAAVLERARATLPPEYQGDGMPFAAIVPVPADASSVDRLIGFMGRQPSS